MLGLISLMCSQKWYTHCQYITYDPYCWLQCPTSNHVLLPYLWLPDMFHKVITWIFLTLWLSSCWLWAAYSTKRGCMPVTVNPSSAVRQHVPFGQLRRGSNHPQQWQQQQSLQPPHNLLHNKSQHFFMVSCSAEAFPTPVLVQGPGLRMLPAGPGHLSSRSSFLPFLHLHLFQNSLFECLLSQSLQPHL